MDFDPYPADESGCAIAFLVLAILLVALALADLIFTLFFS